MGTNNRQVKLENDNTKLAYFASPYFVAREYPRSAEDMQACGNAIDSFYKDDIGKFTGKAACIVPISSPKKKRQDK